MTTEQPDCVATLQKRIRLAHQARRAKERQLDDIRHALMDVGVIEEGDPYSHADLANVIRQLDDELNRPSVTAETGPDLKTQLAEAEALAGRWEEKYFEQVNKRSEALAAIDRVQKVPTTPEIMNANEPEGGYHLRGYEQGVRATKAALRSPTEPTRWSGGYFDADGRPTDWEGIPLGYAQMTAAGWNFCDGCRTWSQATPENPHRCRMTYIKGPFRAES